MAATRSGLKIRYDARLMDDDQSYLQGPAMVEALTAMCGGDDDALMKVVREQIEKNPEDALLAALGLLAGMVWTVCFHLDIDVDGFLKRLGIRAALIASGVIEDEVLDAAMLNMGDGE